jgi:hypothetical protein
VWAGGWEAAASNGRARSRWAAMTAKAQARKRARGDRTLCDDGVFVLRAAHETADAKEDAYAKAFERYRF